MKIKCRSKKSTLYAYWCVCSKDSKASSRSHAGGRNAVSGPSCWVFDFFEVIRGSLHITVGGATRGYKL